MAGTDGEVDELSRRLLGRVDELRGLEEQKRTAPRSSPEFHRLADQIEEKAREVFALADSERDLGTDDSPITEERRQQTPGDWASPARQPRIRGERDLDDAND